MLSRAIAAAGSNVEGPAIAKAYGLVDKVGKLQGAEKPLTLKDGTETSVRILGFRHDELARGGKAGISFEFADIPVDYFMGAYWTTHRGGWEKSGMRTWLNGEFFTLLPDDLRPLVESASKRTNNADEVIHKNDTSVVSSTEDRLWLLLVSEIYGWLSNQENVSWLWSRVTYDAEGIQYQLYADHNVSTTHYDFCKKEKGRESPWRLRSPKKEMDRESSWWWLRSPSAFISDWFCLVRRCGGWGDWDGGYDGGVSPGFCL